MITTRIFMISTVLTGMAGCGDVNVNGDPTVTVASDQASVASTNWSEEETAEIREECTDSNSDRQNTAPVFCKCYVEALSKMTDYETFVENKDKYFQKMRESGESAKCAEAAGIKPLPEPTKIYIGMSKAQVLKILGSPSEVNVISYVGTEEWLWFEKAGEDKICFPEYPGDNECSVYFRSDGVLIRQRGIKSEFVDLTK